MRPESARNPSRIVGPSPRRSHRLPTPARRRPDIARTLIEALEPRTLLASGELDATFNGGAFSTDIASTFDAARGVAVQPDGKIIAVGSASNDFNFGGDVVLVRYTPAGQLDPTFGVGGVVRTDLGARENAEAVLVQPDGKIVVGGWTVRDGSPDRDFALLRYDASGNPDPAFGVGGLARLDFGGNAEDAIHALALQPDGKILAAGVGTTSGNMLAVARYRADGTLDPAFAAGGKFLQPINGGNARALAVALQTDGKIVLAGQAFGGASGGHATFSVTRLTAAGDFDPGFGVGGSRVHDVGPAALQAVAVAPDGSLYAAGPVLANNSATTQLVKYTPAGAIDASFGSGGVVTVFNGGFLGLPVGLAVQPNGKPVVAATAGPAGAPGGDFGVARFTPTGAPDPAFGTDGRTVVPLGGQSNAHALAFQPDGKIVVAGYNAGDFGLARFTNDDPVPPANDTISGRKFIDRNADGLFDPGDAPAPNAFVFLDLNDNGVHDAGGPAPLPRTFQSADVPRSIPSVGAVESTLFVGGFDGELADLDVKLGIDHSWDEDLDVFLIGPTGTVVELFTDVGGGGRNFADTTLDDEAAVSIAAASAPFTGTFRPEGLLSAFDGQNPNGTWTLRVVDDTNSDGGLLANWSIVLQDASTPAEPSTFTDADGNYAFNNLPPGTYVVRDSLSPGHVRTTPAAHTMTLAPGQNVAGRNFGSIPTVFTGTSSNDGYTLGAQPGNPGRLQVVASDGTYSASRAVFNSLTFNLGGGNDYFVIDYVYGDPIPVGGVQVNGGIQNTSAGDTLDIRGASAGETFHLINPAVTAPAGKIAVSAFEAVSVSGGGGDDRLILDVALFANVTFSGDAGRDELVYNASESDDAVAIETSSIDDGSFGHTYFDIEDLRINARFGFDTVSVLQYSPAPRTVIDLGPGDDTAEIIGSPFPVTVLGSDGNDTLAVTNSRAAPPVFTGGSGYDSYDNSSQINSISTDLRDSGVERLLARSGGLWLDATQHLDSFVLLGDARVFLAPGSAKTIFAKTLTITSTARLDLRDNDLVLETTPANRDALLAAVTAYVRSGRNGGKWNGSGILSEHAAVDITKRTGLAVVPTDAGILVKYTWNGDADADGALTIDDYYHIDAGFLARADAYHRGDFDYNLTVDLDDYALIDLAYLGQNSVL